MNALGRLDDAIMSPNCADDARRTARQYLAGNLERLNREAAHADKPDHAVGVGDRGSDPTLLQFNALRLPPLNGIPAWWASVASRMVEEFGKPAALLLNRRGGAR